MPNLSCEFKSFDWYKYCYDTQNYLWTNQKPTGTTLKVTHMTGKIGNLRNSQNFYPFLYKYFWQRHLLDVKTLYYHLTYGIRHTLHAILAKTLFYRRLGFQIWNCGAGGFQFNFGNGNGSWTRWEQTLLFGIMVSLRFMLAQFKIGFKGHLTSQADKASVFFSDRCDDCRGL